MYLVLLINFVVEDYNKEISRKETKWGGLGTESRVILKRILKK
jgi:hypothetical protein